MLSENLVSTLLQASITGAGLILAVYGFIIPLFDKILKYRVDSLTKRIVDLKNKPARKFLLEEGSIDDMRNDLNYIESIRKLPSYFSGIVIVSFVLYLLTSLFCMWWFIDWQKEFMNNSIPWTFGIATVLFVLIGAMTIKDLIGFIKNKHETLLKEAVDSIDNPNKN